MPSWHLAGLASLSFRAPRSAGKGGPRAVLGFFGSQEIAQGSESRGTRSNPGGIHVFL